MGEVLVYDAAGEEVLKTIAWLPGTLTLTNLKSGIYLLQVRNEQANELYHSKFIIQQQ
jgi:hypothetical protein